MSTTGLAAPMIAMAMKAAQAVGHAAISSSGSAQKTTPHPKSEASRCRAARPMARSHRRWRDTQYRVQPTESRRAKVGHVEGDRHREDVSTRRRRPSARSTSSPPAAGRGGARSLGSPRGRRRGSWASSLGGRLDRLRVAASGLARRGDRHGGGRRVDRMPQTRTADRAKVSALTAKTAATSVTASRNPANAGPTKNARLSTVLATPLAAVSSPRVSSPATG